MIKRNTYLVLTGGNYSDYGLHGHYRARRAFDPNEELHAYLATGPECSKEWGYKNHLFIDYLVEQGFIQPVPALEIFIGGYYAPGHWTFVDIREV